MCESAPRSSASPRTRVVPERDRHSDEHGYDQESETVMSLPSAVEDLQHEWASSMRAPYQSAAASTSREFTVMRNIGVTGRRAARPGTSS
jgi:hypothetical protein